MDLFKKTEFVPIVSSLLQQKTQWLEDQLLRASERSRGTYSFPQLSTFSTRQASATIKNLSRVVPEVVRIFPQIEI
jgi:hypothetical protein